MSISDDRARESCGVVGVYSPGEDVARIAFFGIYALQHRGQESAGIATGDGHHIRSRTAMGLVAQSLHEDDLTQLPGHVAIGHTRYSTTGSSNISNAQPILSTGPDIELALGHNGNVVNAKELKEELLELDCVFSSSSDSEIIAHLLSHAPATTWEDRIGYAMRRLQGAYCLVIMTKDALFAVRDPLGVRPLCIGSLNGGWVVASETCALDNIGASFVREVEPGEAVQVDNEGLKTIYKRKSESPPASCIFEHIYLARADSILGGKRVYTSRMEMGVELAKEYPVEADLVIGVPDGGTAAGVGYSKQSGIPFGEGLIKNRYVGRTFISPDQRLRDLGARTKYNPLPELIGGKRLVVVDDTIVRGTTTTPLLTLLRKAGAKEVHLRICAPPVMHPCYFGVDFPTRRELIATSKTVEEIRDFLGADSLGYLSHDGLLRATGMMDNGVCMACFTGEYPIPVQLEMDKLALEL